MTQAHGDSAAGSAGFAGGNQPAGLGDVARHGPQDLRSAHCHWNLTGARQRDYRRPEVSWITYAIRVWLALGPASCEIRRPDDTKDVPPNLQLEDQTLKR